MNKAREQPIIIVKKKVYAHGHHGGAWKVAFADFMTAMFAMFLVLWLAVGLAPIAPGQVAMLLFMGLIQLALPLVLFMRGARHAPAAQMVLVSMADAALNPLWVWLVFGEVPAAVVFSRTLKVSD